MQIVAQMFQDAADIFQVLLFLVLSEPLKLIYSLFLGTIVFAVVDTKRLITSCNEYLMVEVSKKK